MPADNRVHVAVAVVKNQQGQYFIAKRHDHLHQGGLWEFPGGKVEKGETVLEALRRECFEEIGITITKVSPLIKVHHDYTDKTVLLDVWTVDAFEGEAHGKENQPVCWVRREELSAYSFPAANIPIIKALQLPDKYMITGDFADDSELLIKVKRALDKGIRLIQFRAHQIEEKEYFNYAKKLYLLCIEYGARLLLNTPEKLYRDYQAAEFSHGLHLTSSGLRRVTHRDISEIIVAASTHNAEELRLAEEKDIDFIVLSPVNKTRSHPGTVPLGWETFSQLVETTNIPVYALGGVTDSDTMKAQQHGAQGIAAISCFWTD